MDISLSEGSFIDSRTNCSLGFYPDRRTRVRIFSSVRSRFLNIVRENGLINLLKTLSANIQR